MKLVLAHHITKYHIFLGKMIDKGKDIASYGYVASAMDVQGYDRDTQVIKLGGYQDHPRYQEIIEACEQRFDMSPRRRNSDIDDIRRRWSAPRDDSYTVSGSIDYSEPYSGGRVAMPRFQSGGVVSSEHLTVTEPTPASRTSPDSLRGMHYDSAIFDETTEGAFLTREILEEARDSIIRHSGEAPTMIHTPHGFSHAEHIREHQERLFRNSEAPVTGITSGSVLRYQMEQEGEL